MKKLLTKIAVAVAGFTGVAVAQQDPQFTQFMYNKLIFNPGYAGTSGAICGALQYRNQWAGFDGAPTTFALSADMPIKDAPIGVGINIMQDKIGSFSTTFARLAGAYNMKIKDGTLGIGIDAGILQKKSNETFITPEPLKIDPILGNNLNKTTVDFGFGAFYQVPGKMYVGISATHLTGATLTSDSASFKLKQHAYLMAGYTFQLNAWSKLTPNILWKSDFAGAALDLNLTYLWSDMIWVGATFRPQDAACALIGYQGKAGVGNTISYKIGYSYDYTLSKISGYSNGSHEIILGVCYTPKKVMPTTYGNDRFLD